MHILKISKEDISSLNNVTVNTSDTAKYLRHNMHMLNHEDVAQVSDYENGNVSNVIKGLNDYVYMTSVVEDNFENVKFQLIYIHGVDEVKGFLLDINTYDNDWMAYIGAFTMFLSKTFSVVDPIDGYNTFMSKIRTALEKMDFFTLTWKDLRNPKYAKGAEFVVPNPRGIIVLRFEDKLSVYKEIFLKTVSRKNENRDNKIYLMYSNATNLIKIGRSINPKNREKTLQGQDPGLDIITYWIAPISVEKELQNIFIEKRKRGEWFNLDFGDLMQIRDYMKKYD